MALAKGSGQLLQGVLMELDSAFLKYLQILDGIFASSRETRKRSKKQ